MNTMREVKKLVGGSKWRDNVGSFPENGSSL